MKKLLFILAAVGVMSFASSCKKCYHCSNSSIVPGEYCDDVYNQAQLDVLKSQCESNGATWGE